MKTTSLALVTVALLYGCANSGANYKPLVDLQGRSAATFQNDLGQCQSYASQVTGAGERAAVGAVAGAVIGAVIAGLFGGDRRSRNDTTMVGAISGGSAGGVAAEDEQRNIIRRCLSGRGYNVLN